MKIEKIELDIGYLEKIKRNIELIFINKKLQDLNFQIDNRIELIESSEITNVEVEYHILKQNLLLVFANNDISINCDMFDILDKYNINYMEYDTSVELTELKFTNKFINKFLTIYGDKDRNFNNMISDMLDPYIPYISDVIIDSYPYESKNIYISKIVNNRLIFIVSNYHFFNNDFIDLYLKLIQYCKREVKDI